MTGLDEMMGFDPNNMSIFNETTTGSVDSRIYKSQPKLSKSEDGIYRSKIRILFNPHSIKESVVNLESYYIRDADGGLTVPSSLSIGDKNCPIFKGFKKMRYAGEDGSAERAAGLARAKEIFQKNSAYWVLIQIIEDENQPELVGQFKFWKLPTSIFNKLNAKMKPTDTKKMPDPLMDYLFGKILELEVTPGPDDPSKPHRKQSEIKYDLSEFDADVTPITNLDGTPLFSDEELAVIDSYVAEKKKIGKKGEKEKDEMKRLAQRTADIQKLNDGEIGNAVRVLYSKAIEFMSKNAPNVCDLSYKPWDEATTERVNNWLAAVDSGADPSKPVNTSAMSAADSLPDMFDEEIKESIDSEDEDDLPF